MSGGWGGGGLAKRGSAAGTVLRKQTVFSAMCHENVAAFEDNPRRSAATAAVSRGAHGFHARQAPQPFHSGWRELQEAPAFWARALPRESAARSVDCTRYLALEIALCRTKTLHARCRGAGLSLPTQGRCWEKTVLRAIYALPMVCAHGV